MTDRMTVGLVDKRARKEEYFILDSEKFALFNTCKIEFDGKIKKLAPNSETDYKVIRAALRFFSESTVSFTLNDLIVQLAAGHNYSSELKERTKEMLVTRMIGALEINELETIADAIGEYDAEDLRPFLVCNLLHCKDAVLDTCDIDPNIVNFSKELRATAVHLETNTEITRYRIQSEINRCTFNILKITNRYESVANLAESVDLSNLLGCFEKINSAFTHYLREEQIPFIGDLVFGFQPDNSITEITEQLKEASKIFKTLKEIHPEMISEARAQKQIEENERVIASAKSELERLFRSESKPIGFNGACYALYPGLEVGYISGKSTLWINENQFNSISEELVQKVMDTLKVEKLAIGSQVFGREPMIEYYTYYSSLLPAEST